MKRTLTFFSFIVIFLYSFASGVKEKEGLAQKHYAEGKYEQAISIYKSLLSDENESAELFYNIGNAYYKNGETAKSILNYERALLVSPNFDDAKYNLGIAQLKIVDKIDEIDGFFFTRWIDAISNLMTSDGWAWLSVGLFFVFILFVLIYVFGKNEIFRKIAFFTGVFILFFSFSSLSFAYKHKNKVEKREYAIIMDASTTVKSSPDHSGTDLFVLHEGTKVKIRSALGEWFKVQLADGNVGWVKKTCLERI